jgi:hypothetical protein
MGLSFVGPLYRSGVDFELLPLPLSACLQRLATASSDGEQRQRVGWRWAVAPPSPHRPPQFPSFSSSCCPVPAPFPVDLCCPTIPFVPVLLRWRDFCARANLKFFREIIGAGTPVRSWSGGFLWAFLKSLSGEAFFCIYSVWGRPTEWGVGRSPLVLLPMFLWLSECARHWFAWRSRSWVPPCWSFHFEEAVGGCVAGRMGTFVLRCWPFYLF